MKKAGIERSIAGRLIALAAPPDIRDAVLGDFEERYSHLPATGGRIPLKTLVLSLAHLMWIRCCAIERSDLSRLSAAGLISVAAAQLWESQIARLKAWPITAHFLDNGFVPIPLLYMGVYVLLYLVGGIIVLVGSLVVHRRVRREEASAPRDILLPAFALSIPPVVYMFHPAPYDFIFLRVVQLAALWLLVATVWRISVAGSPTRVAAPERSTEKS